MAQHDCHKAIQQQYIMSQNQRCVKGKISGVAGGWPGKRWVLRFCLCGRVDPKLPSNQAARFYRIGHGDLRARAPLSLPGTAWICVS